jgi:hypothetical protein
MNLLSYPEPRQLWTPQNYAGVGLWLDAMAPNTVTGAAPVTAWADRSGGLPFVVPSGGVGPAYSATGLNSAKPALTFNGTTHALARNSFPFYAAGQATLYFVVR